MDIISRLKNTISNYDIEQKTKKITQSNLTFEQKEKLQEIKDINKIMDNLDVHYMTHYFDFKSRLLCENNKIKEQYKVKSQYLFMYKYNVAKIVVVLLNVIFLYA